MSKNKHIFNFKIFEHVNNGVDVVVGLLILCSSTNRVFLIQRNDHNKYWSLITGGFDHSIDIDYLDCIKREMYEELRYRNLSKIKIINGGDEFIESKNRNFKYYYGIVDEEFSVVLDDENLNWGWFSINGQSRINNQFNVFGLPKNLYPGSIHKIQTIFKLF